MDERVIAAFFIGIVVGVLGSALVAGKLYGGRSTGEIDRLNQQYDQLTREYTERQRELEAGIGLCLGYVESARTITERTSENTGRAISNLTEAVGLIRAGIEERKSLKVELDCIRAGLYRIRDMGRLEVE